VREAGEVAEAAAVAMEADVEVVDTEAAVEAMVAADTEVAAEAVDMEEADMAVAVTEVVVEAMEAVDMAVAVTEVVEEDTVVAVEAVDTEVAADIEILYRVLLLFELVRLSHLYPIWSLLKTVNLTLPA